MDQRIATSISSHQHWTIDDIREAIEESPVVAFTRGTADHPRCGFSKRVFDIFKDCKKHAEIVDICQDKSILPALRAYAGRKSLPLIFVNGTLACSADTLQHGTDISRLREKVITALQ